ncbi:MAG: cytidine deaminase [bacterium]
MERPFLMGRKTEEFLINHAREAREKAYAPFSGFRVGSALLCRGGSIYTGCNIENPSLSLSICAERVAFVKAISEGNMDFEALAVVADTPFLTYPCGACRQMIWDFGHEVRIVLANLEGKTERTTIKKLLPKAFDFHPG